VLALALAACAGSPQPETTPVRLNWPELASSELSGLGGGESDAAVIIAIEEYAHFDRVEGALKSAVDWYAYFTRDLHMPASRVRLENVLVTASKMRAAVQKAKAQVHGRGRLWVVFIGQGAPPDDMPGAPLKAADGLLLDSVAAPDALTGLKQSELLALVQPGARGRRGPVLIIDACCSGDVASPDVITFRAASGSEATSVLPGAAVPRRAFSYLLAGGLRGWADAAGDADGAVTPEEAIAFTLMALQRVGLEQTPRLSGRVSVPLLRVGEVPPQDFDRVTTPSRDYESSSSPTSFAGNR
jgi:hypothetical protein